MREVSSTSPSVRSRSHSGAGMNTGAAPSSAAGVTSRRRSSSQTSHDSMCREIRLRIRTLKCPSQPSRIAASSWHPPVLRTRRDTSSAPRERSMVSRSRCTMVLAVPGLTSSASARSGPLRPCRNASSSTERSRSDSPPAASAIRSASSVRAASVSGPGSPDASSGSSSDGVSRRRSRIRRSASLRQIEYSQGLNLSGSRSCGKRVAAMQNASCTQSAAASRSPRIPAQKSCSRSA